mgnify:CR=1 FL=1
MVAGPYGAAHGGGQTGLGHGAARAGAGHHLHLGGDGLPAHVPLLGLGDGAAGGRAGAALWDRFQDEAATALETRNHQIVLGEGVDPVAANAVATAIGMIPLVFQSHLARNLGSDQLDGEAYQRLMTTLMDLLMNGLYELKPKGESA